MSQQHVTSVRCYSLVFAALLTLLLLTVAIAFLPLGRWAAVVAISIAMLKAVLIMVFFMHLRHQDDLTRVFAVSGSVWLLLLFVFLVSDYETRDNVEPAYNRAGLESESRQAP